MRPYLQFKNVYSPVANFTTIPVHVSSPIQLDIALKLAYVMKILNLIWDIISGIAAAKKSAKSALHAVHSNLNKTGPLKETLLFMDFLISLEPYLNRNTVISTQSNATLL